MEFRGYVSGFRARTEQQGQAWVTIWDFRLERVDDAGNPLPRVPVALRGLTIDGAINDDDLVVVDGNWHEGVTLNVTQAHNLTTAARVVGHGAQSATGGAGRVLATLFGLAVLAALAYSGYLVITGYWKPF